VLLLDKPERNALFLVIQEQGYDPRDFDVEHDAMDWRLTHRAWGDWFSIVESAAEGPAYACAVGDAKSHAGPLSSLREASELLRPWLQEIKTNHETPDLWAELDKQSSMTELMEGRENTLFTEAEQQQIEAAVAEALRQTREAYDLPEEQSRLLEAKLDYIVEAARHTRRIDWLNVAVGAIAGAFAGGVLTPEVVQKVLGALGAGLGPLFGHPVPMLGP
jgi:hypothetical protein